MVGLGHHFVFKWTLVVQFTVAKCSDCSHQLVLFLILQTNQPCFSAFADVLFRHALCVHVHDTLISVVWCVCVCVCVCTCVHAFVCGMCVCSGPLNTVVLVGPSPHAVPSLLSLLDVLEKVWWAQDANAPRWALGLPLPLAAVLAEDLVCFFVVVFFLPSQSCFSSSWCTWTYCVMLLW